MAGRGNDGTGARLVLGPERRRAENGADYPVFEPSRGREQWRAPLASAADVDEAVEWARRATGEWDALGARGRSDCARAFAAAVRGEAEELALLDARNTGSPIEGHRHGVRSGADRLEYFAGLTLELGGRTIPASRTGFHFTTRVPFGVAAVITAFNHPATFATGRTAGLLLAGNTIVCKPAEQTPLSSLRIGEIAQQHLPAGVFNVVSGGAATGGALVRHRDVRYVSFTGSVPTALRIQQDAAQSGHIKRFGFELGGKNPLIILPDVPLERAVDAAIRGMNLPVVGQSCGSTSRLFVHADVHADVVEGIAERMAALRFGWPEEAGTELGSLVSSPQRDRVESYVAAGRADGARLVCGGERATEHPFVNGYYYRPTLFDRVDPHMKIAQEEIFGPVLSVIRWSDESEMMRAVNGVGYGLTASIYTNDLAAAHRIIRHVEAGYIWVNEVGPHYTGLPFGGLKNSGMGNENSMEAFMAATLPKSVHMNFSD